MSRRTLAAQIAMVTTLVAVVATAISFLVSANLVRGAAEGQARSTLGHYADLVAESSADAAGTRIGGAVTGVRALSRLATITALRVRPTGRVVGAAPGALPASVVAAAAAGQVVDTDITVNGHAYFAEGRPLDTGGSVLLLQPHTAARSITTPLRKRLLIALAAGLGLAVSPACGCPRGWPGRSCMRPARPSSSRTAGATCASHRRVPPRSRRSARRSTHSRPR